jgi:hypothetical protein
VAVHVAQALGGRDWAQRAAETRLQRWRHSVRRLKVTFWRSSAMTPARRKDAVFDGGESLLPPLSMDAHGDGGRGHKAR